MTMKCLHDNMVIVREKSDAEKNGILLPEAAREQKLRAEVICIGPGVQHVQVGDKVLIPMLTAMRMRQTGICDLEVELTPGKPEPALVVKEEDVAVVWLKNEAPADKLTWSALHAVRREAKQVVPA